ncbi:hypothetical protein cypCar_00023727 [Cyprinus carpio]|nr:hypothetical protein cypCar_00023727 [Cyprinus carpio]
MDFYGALEFELSKCSFSAASKGAKRSQIGKRVLSRETIFVLEDEMSYVNGKATYKLTVVPSKNLTVSCLVTNKLGEDTKEISVFSLFEEDTSKPEKNEDGAEQAKVIVGIVVGLLVVAALVGLTYWIYIKKTRQGSWKTGEKEAGTSEESKKLEENNHKADV